MYKIQIPVISATLEPEEALIELKKAGAQRVWLASIRGLEDEERLREELERLKSNRIFFEEKGMEVGVWVGSMGHGGALAQDDPDAKPRREYERLVGLGGGTCEDSFCPTGEAFAQDYSEWIGRIAETGARMIMLDDDFRLSVRPCGNGCCCERHMAEYAKRVGEPVSREQLKKLVFSGGPSKYRDAWLDMGRDSLLQLAGRIRRRVDEVDPEIRVGVCAVLTTWDVDGVDSQEITRTLAGRTKPFLRTFGAPYWASSDPKRRRLQYVLNVSRMQRHWCEGQGIELFSEGDAYPRPRYATPASYLEMFDMALRADGGWDGILKYMIDYTSSIRYEKGYVDRMVRNRPAYDWIERNMAGGTAEGADIVSHTKRLRAAELPEGMTVNEVNDAFFFAAGAFLAGDCGVPTAFGTRGAHIVCGENGRYVTDEQLGDGAVLDVGAAMILMERGVDVGIEALGEAATIGGSEVFPGLRERVQVAQLRRHRDAKLKPGAETLSMIGTHPTAYRYENAAGQRFLVYLFDMDASWEGMGAIRSYCRQSQLIDGLEWVGRKPLPAVCTGQPDIYMICKRTGQGLAVGLWNLSADYIPDAEIRLDGEYELADLFGAEGEIQGRKLQLRGDVPPFAFVGALLKN